MIFDKKKRLRALCALLLVCLLVFAGCSAGLTSLRAFAKPCAGEYECVYAHLGKKDLLKGGQSLTLTLSEDGTFSAVAVGKSGKTKQKGGTWSYDEERQELTFQAKMLGKMWTKTVRLQDGQFTLQQKIAGKNLVLTFRTKL